LALVVINMLCVSWIVAKIHLNLYETIYSYVAKLTKYCSTLWEDCDLIFAKIHS